MLLTREKREPPGYLDYQEKKDNLELVVSQEKRESQVYQDMEHPDSQD